MEALENPSRTSEEVTQRMPRASPERLRTCIESLPIATLETCQSLSGGFPRASQNLPISSQQARQSFSRASQGPHSEPKPLVTDRGDISRDSQDLLIVPSRALQESIIEPSRASKDLPRRPVLDHLKSISGASREALRSLSRAFPVKCLSGAPSEYLKSIPGSPSEPSRGEL